MIQRARSALDAGNAGQALAVLKEYERVFTNRSFIPEALGLEMQARARRGDRVGAVHTAKRIARDYPQAPQAPIARELLSEGAVPLSSVTIQPKRAVDRRKRVSTSLADSGKKQSAKD